MTASSVDVGHYLVDVLALRAVVAMLTRTPPTDIVVLAIGEPDPARNAEVLAARRATLIALCVVASPGG
ncbi:MAG: hypothetical protein OEU32_08065 [Acidimicrobiia bacterium]|nr:hypothetical protein [Acidimicrobiia bacterium]